VIGLELWALALALDAGAPVSPPAAPAPAAAAPAPAASPPTPAAPAPAAPAPVPAIPTPVPGGPTVLPAAPAPAPTPDPRARLTRAGAAVEWGAHRRPSRGKARVIGGCSCGCLQGGATLPASGPGYEVIRLFRNRRYGHPNLIAYVRRLGAVAKRKKLGVVIVGDLSQPRGGPTPTGHRSHQTGLDADIGYAAPAGVRAGRLSRAARDKLSLVPVVDLKTRETLPAWNPNIVRLLAAAASDAAVDRIFVNPVIKKMLCEDSKTAAAPWQTRIRPWRAHHDHFHVRLRCPANSPLCVPQPAPPDNGCGASLAWWFRPPSPEPSPTEKKEAAKEDAVQARFVLPRACGAVARKGRR
jgi:penicillin-insensitive murein endopeptidase